MKDKIKLMILASLSEIKEDCDLDFEVNEKVKLLGKEGVMDSLDFVNFIMDLEERVLEETDKDISILSEKAFSRKKSPFYDVESLSEYIAEVI